MFQSAGRDSAWGTVFNRGERIAELVIQRIEIASFVQVDAFSESERGIGGFGSTGGFKLP